MKNTTLQLERQAQKVGSRAPALPMFGIEEGTMTDRASYSHGYTKNGQRTEWWHVIKDGIDHFVKISFDAGWFSREGSINDLKQMAIAAA